MLRFFKAAGILLLVAALIALAAVVMWDLQPEKESVQLYPMEYTGLIYENAELQGLEPAYVSAVILAESSYNPQALSSVNAQGLMQITPSTAEWIAGKFDEEYVEGCLFSPETNIRYGCWYLGYLLRRYDGDKVCATAAYHSGQGEVDSWLADPAFSSDGKSLYAIKGENANTYVDRVMKYYEKYKEIYAEAAA
ncbi:MAG: lytic transglycosylase domain-containing protein [Clostridia bacterium]|nr:lytic transglycosylase domain-containing protein [Clostridia bacterium]